MSQLSSLHFWHGCKKDVAAGFYGNFYFSTLVTNHLSRQNPTFQKCHEIPSKNDWKNSRGRFDKILALSTFEYLDIWIFDHLTSEHLNIWTLKHWYIGSWNIEHLNIWAFECLNICHLNIWTFEHVHIWTFEHLSIWRVEHFDIWAFIYLNIWTFKHLNIWSSEHMKIWASEHLYIGTCRAAEIVESCHPGWKNTG